MKSTSSTATQLFNDKTEDLLNEGKTLASTIYEQSVDTLNNVEDSVKEYSEKLVEGVKQNPVTTALIVGGISVLITLLLWKH